MNIQASGFNLAEGDEPHRIHFSTPTVQPTAVPDFPYICTDVGYSCIEFAAIVWANTPEEAASRVMEVFKGSTVQSIEKGVKEIPAEYGHLRCHMYGSLVVPQNVSWWRRIILRQRA